MKIRDRLFKLMKENPDLPVITITWSQKKILENGHIELPKNTECFIGDYIIIDNQFFLDDESEYYEIMCKWLGITRATVTDEQMYEIVEKIPWKTAIIIASEL